MPGLADFAMPSQTKACLPSRWSCIFSILTPGNETENLASFKFSPYNRTMTGETKPVHQLGGSTLLIEGWAATEQERTAITRMTAATMCLGWFKAIPGLSAEVVNRDGNKPDRVSLLALNRKGAEDGAAPFYGLQPTVVSRQQARVW